MKLRSDKSKLVRLLLTIPLVSLSLISLNFSPSALANNSSLVGSKNNQQLTTLIAQKTTCSVINIETGQLALRFSPNGKSKAGLDNGNSVAWLKSGATPWAYVRVTNASDSKINGLEGWVNSNYLSC
jgi:hypothetical protein